MGVNKKTADLCLRCSDMALTGFSQSQMKENAILQIKEAKTGFSAIFNYASSCFVFLVSSYKLLWRVLLANK